MATSEDTTPRKPPPPIERRKRNAPSDPAKALEAALHDTNNIKKVINTLSRTVIVIDEDRVRSELKDFVDAAKRDRWKGPLALLGMLISVVPLILVGNGGILRELSIAATAVILFFLVKSVIATIRTPPRDLEMVMRDIKRIPDRDDVSEERDETDYVS